MAKYVCFTGEGANLSAGLQICGLVSSRGKTE